MPEILFLSMISAGLSEELFATLEALRHRFRFPWINGRIGLETARLLKGLLEMSGDGLGRGARDSVYRWSTSGALLHTLVTVAWRLSR